MELSRAELRIMTKFPKPWYILHILHFLWSCVSSGAEYIESSPSFVSEWITMTANSSTSERNITHGFGEIPLLVKVEAKTEEGWSFAGFGSAQMDNDNNVLYGGVVFIYDHQNIVIFVPNRNYQKDQAETNIALYTGNQEKWEGPKQIGRSFKSVLVRAKAWRLHDLPSASFQSHKINIEKETCVKDTVQHFLGNYPDLVVVQIQTPVWTFQGQGLSSRAMGTEWSNLGGLLYGYNETHVQLWSACNVNRNMKGVRLLSVTDGWGLKGITSVEGFVTIKAWTMPTSIQRFSISELDAANYILRISYRENITSSNVLSVQMEVQDGVNKNFRFDGVGSVMSEFVPYGGLVYGHNETSVAFWIPHPDKRKTKQAAIFMMGKMWGWGYKEQMTDNVDILISISSIKLPVCTLNNKDRNTNLSVIQKNHRYDESMFAVGDKIFLQCVLGYRRSTGNSTLVCNEIGSWNAEILTCEECRCPCSLTGSLPIKANEVEKLQQRLVELKSKLTVLKNATSKPPGVGLVHLTPDPQLRGWGLFLGPEFFWFCSGAS